MERDAMLVTGGGFSDEPQDLGDAVDAAAVEAVALGFHNAGGGFLALGVAAGEFAGFVAVAFAEEIADGRAGHGDEEEEGARR